MFQDIGFNYSRNGKFREPAFCDQCGIVELKDGSDEDPLCSRCKGTMTFYNKDLNGERTYSSTELAFSDYLDKRKYWHCPRCGKNTLKFTFNGLWD